MGYSDDIRARGDRLPTLSVTLHRAERKIDDRVYPATVSAHEWDPAAGPFEDFVRDLLDGFPGREWSASLGDWLEIRIARRWR